jgi:formylglycine-generating enzyme required for sulfatase activity
MDNRWTPVSPTNVPDALFRTHIPGRQSIAASWILAVVVTFAACSTKQNLAQQPPGSARDKVGKARFEMIEITGGTFTMGAGPAEPQHDDWLVKRLASPFAPHRVTLSDFWLGKYEVTQALWREAAALPKVNIDLKPDPAQVKGDDMPVQNVSWLEAAEFCDRLSRATGRRYRLPTEAEWEYACRAGATGLYSGDLDKMGWYAANSGIAPLSDQMLKYALASNDYTGLIERFKCQPHPVGQKQPNAWGLYDMHGNVSEWCQDWLGDYPAADQQNPSGPGEPGVLRSRLHRGGDYFGTADRCTSANREAADPKAASPGIGFRLARDKG